MTAEKTSSRSRAQHQSAINFMPVEGRVYFVRDPTAVKDQRGLTFLSPICFPTPHHGKQ
jgi:hypothetical protein